jgi:hypothetical protein
MEDKLSNLLEETITEQERTAKGIEEVDKVCKTKMTTAQI